MEILFGFISSIIVEAIKLFSKKYGEELSKKIVHGIVFTFTLVFTGLMTNGIISMDIINHYVQIFVTSYTSYNLLIKPISKQLT